MALDVLDLGLNKVARANQQCREGKSFVANLSSDQTCNENATT